MRQAKEIEWYMVYLVEYRVESTAHVCLIQASENVAGATGEEFVYMVPDYVRSEAKTDIWTDRSVKKIGGVLRGVHR